LVLERLVGRIRHRKAKIGILGLGYVGLPLAVAFARNGYTVTGLDIDRSKIARLRRGKSYVMDVPSGVLQGLLKRGLLKVAQDARALGFLDVVIICVPTPLSKTHEPDVSYIVAAAKTISGHLRKGQLVVLESTTYPGTTEEVVLPLLKKSGLLPDRDFFLAFSPERVDPGNKIYDTVSIAKVVGGIGKNSLAAAKALYGSVMKSVVEVSSAKAAEMTKLLENTFRSVNIALINEIALLCHRLGVDIWEVIGAAKTKPFGFMPFYPGPGIGGHCLPIDPLYLSWKSRLHGFEAKIIELASVINESMPVYVVERITQLLNRERIPMKNAQVLVLGVAYKRDIDDVRESPALDIVNRLFERGSQVSYSDPWVPVFQTGRHTLRSKTLTPALIQKQQCVVVLTDHAAFDYGLVVKHSRRVFDTRNALRKFEGKRNVSFL
jgi:UDP-N-acetyl-D-glucosamine dehydrogenase